MKTNETISIPSEEDISRAGEALTALAHEHETLNLEIREMEASLVAKKKRREEIKSSYGGTGLLPQAKNAHARLIAERRDAALPAMIGGSYWAKEYVIRSVDAKWITVGRRGGFCRNEEIRYRVSDGIRERCRSGWDKIDAAANVAAWEAHNSAPNPAPPTQPGRGI